MLRFLDMETSIGPQRSVPASVEYSVVIYGALVTCPSRHLCMTYCCALIPCSKICVTCQSCWFPDLVAISCCAGKDALGEGWRHMYEMDMGHFANPNLSVNVIIIITNKKDWQRKAGRGRLTPYQSDDPQRHTTNL